MLLFFTISFFAGVLTVLAPCILPLLPIIIGGSVANGSKVRAYTVIASLIVSVIAFTLLIKVSSLFLNVPPETWKYISGFILGVIGLTMIFPLLWESIPFVAKMSQSSNQLLGVGLQKKNMIGDVIMGAALGPVFSTCSPTYFVILATVLPAHFLLGLLYLFAYSLGLGLALLAISIFGQKLADKLAVTADSRGLFKKTIGAIFIVVSVLIISGYDKKLQVFVGDHFFDVTKLEQKLLKTTEDMKSSSGRTSQEGVAVSPLPGSSIFPSLGRYAEITSPAGFVNTNDKPVKIGDYIGKKIILIDFMTYSCINCIRTFPYLVSWDTKYKDKGLMIIGIHTPEFAFEKKKENVISGLSQYGISFPVVLDNEYGTWGAYKNQYWPRKFIIDLNGNIVYDHIGEGKYEETEEVIQKLLKTLPENKTLFVATIKDDENLMPANNISPESYLGYARIQYHVSAIKDECEDSACTYKAPENIPLNRFAFDGKWSLDSEHALGETGGTLTYHAKAKKIHLVAAPETSITSAKIEVYVDGTLSKTITVDKSDLYTLVANETVKDQKVTIKIISGKLLGYAFTFG